MPKNACLIEHIIPREVIDSRGFPTVEVEVVLKNGMVGRAIAPSGASTGKFEALEMRDSDLTRFQGKGVLKVIRAIRRDISPHLIGLPGDQQALIDGTLCRLDGTENKSHLGANALLPISMACAKAAAQAHAMPLYRYLGGSRASTLPVPLINILNGGAHANNGLDIQEFMIVPIAARDMMEAIELCASVFHTLKSQLKGKGFSTAVGDEGGVAPPLQGTIAALDTIMEAIVAAGLTPNKDIALALDVAASELYDGARSLYHMDGTDHDSNSLIHFYGELVNQYPIVSIEDPLDQEDFHGYQKMTELLGERIQIVGDDIFVTNRIRLDRGIKMGAANAILIKLNQIGTVTETLDVIDHALHHGYTTIISHRSGETEDTFIADLAVGVNAGQIKTGSLCRSERTAKYNQLLRIQESLGGFSRLANDFLRRN